MISGVAGRGQLVSHMATGWLLLWVTTLHQGEKSEDKTTTHYYVLLSLWKYLQIVGKDLIPAPSHLWKLLVVDTLGKTDPQLKTSLHEICLRQARLRGTCGGHRTTQWGWVSAFTLRGARWLSQAHQACLPGETLCLLSHSASPKEAWKSLES